MLHQRPKSRKLARVARLLAATLVLVFLAADFPRAIAWMSYLNLPGTDYIAEATKLADRQRYRDALAFVDAGLADETYAAVHRQQLLKLRAEIEREQKSWVNKVKRGLQGAIAGTGSSTEALVGAVLADLLVIGDVRDLAIQGVRLVEGQDVDEVIVALSAIGVVTTAAGPLDVGAAVTKLAAKTGRLSRRLLASLVDLARAARRGETGPLRRFLGDVARITRSAGGETTLLILRHADDPADVARAARYVSRYGDEATVALRLTGKEGLRVLRSGDEAAELALKMAAKKGRFGQAWLRSGLWKRMLRPHPFIGLAKGLAKGTLPDLAERLVRAWILPYYWLLLPAAVFWFSLECFLLLRRWLARTQAKAAATAAA